MAYWYSGKRKFRAIYGYLEHYNIGISKLKELSMNTLPQISDAEFEVMNIIWKYAPINTNDMIEKLSKE